jgi:hypothetical protein
MDVLHRPAVARPAPFGVLVAGGTLVALAATIVAAAVLPPAATDARVAVVALAVGVVAARTANVAASLATGSVAFLLATGFLLNRYGELSWHGEQTVVQLSLVAGAVAVGLGLRRIGSTIGAVRRAVGAARIEAGRSPRPAVRGRAGGPGILPGPPVDRVATSARAAVARSATGPRSYRSQGCRPRRPAPTRPTHPRR